ncbi:hypothetical protein, partial [Streptomyces lavendulae]|uniref:hypothetical protein n=1 Tax=Streptomyces lavendulae TaxID=1914 RepID=UPI001F2D02BF
MKNVVQSTGTPWTWRWASGQDPARTDLQEGTDAQVGEGGDGIGEADGLADVAHPVVGRGELFRSGRSTGEGRDERQARRSEGDSAHDGPEVVEHRV